MPRPRLRPGPHHPITIEKSAARVVVRAGDVVVADSTRTLRLREHRYPPVHYVPLEDVDRSLLVPTDTRTYCPYKGDCSYYTVRTPSGDFVDAVWHYRQPYPAVAEIEGHVAFYPNRVRVEVG